MCTSAPMYTTCLSAWLGHELLELRLRRLVPWHGVLPGDQCTCSALKVSSPRRYTAQVWSLSAPEQGPQRQSIVPHSVKT